MDSLQGRPGSLVGPICANKSWTRVRHLACSVTSATSSPIWRKQESRGRFSVI
jgi:hypothetical protein